VRRQCSRGEESGQGVSETEKAMSAPLVMKGARAFGVALGVDEDDDLPFTAAYSPSASSKRSPRTKPRSSRF
jgi:hypothetical protein